MLSLSKSLKRAFSLGLMLLMLLSCAHVGAFADGGEAAEPVESAESVQTAPTVITSLRITDLDEPRAGVAFDTLATAEGAGQRWEIPVYWVDADGETVETPEAGKSYLPVFALYLPAAYVLSADAAFALPAFLDRGELAAVVDEEKGIIFLSGCSYKVPAAAAFSWVDDGYTPEIIPPDDEAQEEHISDYFVTEDVIEKYGYEFMDWFVDLIVYKIEPQAVNALLEGFPVYQEAQARGGLGENIGLYIYEDADDDSMAYVQFGYDYEVEDEEDVGDVEGALHMQLCYSIGINMGWFVVWDEETESWQCEDAVLVDLENALLHEMMHAFMCDYTPVAFSAFVPDRLNKYYGIQFEDYDDWPLWVFEGSASSTQNFFEYHRGFYEWLPDNGANQIDRDYLQNTYSVCADQIGLSVETVFGAYGMGTLAIYYLSALANGTEDLTAESYDSADFRNGLNTILQKLHDGETMDEVIADVSGGLYADVADFEASFVYDDVSADFCVSFLNYLYSIDGGDGRRANGSMLLPFDTQLPSSIDMDVDASAPVYQITAVDGAYVSSNGDGAEIVIGILNFGDWKFDDGEEAEDPDGEDEKNSAAEAQAAVSNSEEEVPAAEGNAPVTDPPAAEESPAAVTDAEEEAPAARGNEPDKEKAPAAAEAGAETAESPAEQAPITDFGAEPEAPAGELPQAA